MVWYLENSAKKSASGEWSECQLAKSQWWNPTIRAAHYDHIGVMEMLLQHGADPSIDNKYGEASLNWERVNDSEEATQLLEKV